MSDQLNAVRMVWRDLVDDDLRRLFRKYTACGLEDVTREMLRERMPIYAAIARELRKKIDDPELHEQCVIALQDFAATDECGETSVATYFVGGERAQRTGEARARRMIKEAWLFGETFVQTRMPFLDDDVEDDSD